MRKCNTLLAIGFLVFVVPFLGIPESWKAVLLFVFGALVLLLAFALRLEIRKYGTDETAIYHEESQPDEIEETRFEPIDETYTGQL